MEILIESFLLFTCLMFWIMFYNKKGLLAEIRKTEKKITEKIIVLEDLLDSAKAKSLIAEGSKTLEPIQNTELTPTIALLNKADKKPKDSSEVYEPKSSNTLLRVLSLDDAENLDFFDTDSGDLPTSEVIQAKDTDTVEGQIQTSSVSHSEEDEDFEDQSETQQEEDSLGVTQMILEARDNLKKIEVSDNIKLKSFKDVVLMSKKIEFEKRK